MALPARPQHHAKLHCLLLAPCCHGHCANTTCPSDTALPPPGRYALSAGPKFGAHLLAYPGDPCLFHAQFGVRVLDENAPMAPQVRRVEMMGSRVHAGQSWVWTCLHV